MKNRVLIIILALVMVMGFFSCGIFGKGCGCPTFGYVDHAGSKDIVKLHSRSSKSGIATLTFAMTRGESDKNSLSF